VDKLIVGCGYLGRRVAARWIEQEHRVFGTTRTVARAEELARLGIEPVVCDVMNPQTLRALPVTESVLYCIGFDRRGGALMQAVYVDGLHNFLAVRNGGSTFIYVSSTGVYGHVDGGWVDETAPTAPLEESGRVVLEAEGLLRQQQCTILRFAGIYGPNRVIRRQAVEKGEPLIGDADKWLNLIHVDDGASAVLAAEASGQPAQVYNISDGNPVMRRDFYTRMAQLLAAPAPRFVQPEPGAPAPPHERANRRISNRRMREELKVQLRYPCYEEGLKAALS